MPNSIIYACGDYVKLKSLRQCNGLRNKNPIALAVGVSIELMQCAEDSADISSIRVASEMCLTMHDELMGEVDQISKEIKEQDKSKVIEILKEQDK